MFEVFRKLMYARQIQFEKGRIILMKEPVTMGPASTFVYILKNSKKIEETSYFIYRGSKEAVQKGFGDAIMRAYGLKKDKLRQWLKDIAEFTGWGTLEFIKLDFTERTAIIRAVNSTVAELYGKTDKPVDHILRGYIAGGGSVSFEQNVDAIETKCKAMGHKYCEFIVAPRNILQRKFKDSGLLWQIKIS